MKKIILGTYIAVLAFTLLTAVAIAGGGPKGTHVRFVSGGYTYDTYWKETGSGLLHEWRYNDPTGTYQGMDLHLVFKPANKFSMADCDDDNLLTSFYWTFNPAPYIDLNDDEADLDNFLNDGESYWVCIYNWTD